MPITAQKQSTNTLSQPHNLLLIDGSNLAFRMFFALEMSNLRNIKGEPTWAVYGTLKALFDCIEKAQPTAIAVAFDLPQPSFRHELFEAYKANRPDEMPDDLKLQWPLIKNLFRHLHIPVIEEPGYEADDVIGIMARKAENQGYNVVILSGDKDLYQLVTDKVSMAVPQRGGGLKIMGPADVVENLGVNPIQVPDYKGIAGDSSDNIPGVKGLGPKAAINLLTEYGSLEGIYANIDKVGPPKTKEKLIEQEANARLSKHIATIITDESQISKNPHLGLEACHLEVPETGPLVQFLKDMEFTSVLKRLPVVLKPFNHGKMVQVDVGEINEPTKQENQTKPAFKQIQNPTIEELDKPLEDLVVKPFIVKDKVTLNLMLKELNKVERYAIDLETTGLNTLNCEIVGIALAYEHNSELKTFYIPTMLANAPEFTIDEILVEIKPLLEDKSKLQIIQNAKFEKRIFRRYGIKTHNNFYDTMLASYVEDPSNKHGLKAQSKRVFRWRMTEIEELIGTGRKQITINEAPLTEVAEYAAADAYVTYKLHEYYENSLDKNGKELLKHIEFPLVDVLVDIESNGVSLDVEHFRKLSVELKQKIQDLEQGIYKLSGTEFNVSSPKQLSGILFDEMNIAPVGKKNKTGAYSTDISTLETLLLEYKLDTKQKDFIKCIIEYRTLTKLSSTYVETLPNLIAKETGRLHSDFNQVVTATGRLSSSNPNLQNIPIRDKYGREIRRGFIAKDSKHSLICADYSQIELRILAHMANEKALIEAFLNKQDIHKRTAMEILGKTESEITDDDRRLGKTLNFALIYMQGPFATAKQLGISMSEARDFIKKYFTAFPNIQPFMDKILAGAHEDGYVETIFGRRRYFKNINSPNKMLQKEEERQAFNTPLQGTAADIIKKAMIELYDSLNWHYPEAKIILQVHDELIIECPTEIASTVATHVQEKMQNVIKLKVPLIVDLAIGQNWLDAA